MRKKSLNIMVLSFLTVFFAFGAGAAKALPPQPPNLQIQLQGPASAMVRSPYVYTVTVTNIGGSTAAGVQVVVDLPETNTSPQKYILGTLSGVDSRCQIVSRKLNCSLGSITHSGQNRTKTFTFTFALPVSTLALQFKATATTTTPNEINPLNNSATFVPTPAYATNQLTSATVLITMCTGRGLSSFYECELFPSSQQQHIFTLNPDLTVTAYGQNVGTWDQFASAQQLHLLLSGGSAEFKGFASGNTCFEGITTFTPDNGYNSAYKVCVQ